MQKMMNTFLLTLENKKIKNLKKYCEENNNTLDSFKNEVEGIAITRFYPDIINKNCIICMVEGKSNNLPDFFKKLEENNFKIIKKQKLVPI